MDNSNGLTYVITRLIVLTNVLILCMLINSKLVIYIIILILSYLFGLPQLNLYAKLFPCLETIKVQCEQKLFSTPADNQKNSIKSVFSGVSPLFSMVILF